MPFSVSHVAAVVPIHWIDRRLSLSALAIGSMIPDMGYLVANPGLRSYSHSTEGIFTLCWPVGVLALVIFQCFLKVPLLWLLPAGHRWRLQTQAAAFHWGSPLRVVGLCLLVLLGALTHKAWDALTHQGSLTYRLGLDAVVANIDDVPVRIYSLLQWTSSIGGLLLLAIWYLLWFRRQPAPHITLADYKASRARFWGAAILLMAVYWMIAVFVMQFGMNDFEPGVPDSLLRMQQFLGNCIMCSLMASALLSFIYATVFWLTRLRDGIA